MIRRRLRAVPPTWRIGTIERRDDGAGLQAVVAGARLRFGSDDLRLAPSSEAFAGPFLLPAMKAGARFRIEGPVDPSWVLGTRTLAGVFAEWWGYPAAYPFEIDRVVRDDRPPAPGHALCFTGGVDSFFALLSASSRYDHLLYVHGLDIPLHDRVRREAHDRSLAAVARETGKRLAVLSTDIRAHPVFASVAWDRTHGAVLAAAGHLLEDRIGHLSIPPSWTAHRLQPWGSHPRTDELWSTHRLRIRHGDVGVGRRERIRRIAHYPIVRHHLRVCWENRSPTGNCARCEKCLRTMTTLAGFGELDRSEAFDLDEPLEARIASLARLPEAARPLWAELLEIDLPPSVRGAVESLLARSRLRWWERFGRRRRV